MRIVQTEKERQRVSVIQNRMAKTMIPEEC
jgi:hypothetical protein